MTNSHDVRAPAVLDGEASAVSAARLRHEFAAWLIVDVTGDLADDLVLAVYEAISNVADHAYTGHPGGVGPVRVHAHRHPDTVTVSIADDGTWNTTPSGPHRGRGLHLIRHLVPDTYIETTAIGTTVHLRAPAPPI